MLIQSVAGNTYLRNEFAADGTLEGRTRLRVGALERQQDGSYAVSIGIEDLTKPSSRGSIRSSRWTCNGDALGMLVNVLVFAADGKHADVRVQITGPPLRYPNKPTMASTLPDTSFELKARRGISSWLGGRTQVALRDRRIKLDAEQPARYEIDASVTTTSRLLGLPLKRHSMRSIEVVQDGELIRQELLFVDGSRTTIVAVEAPRG